MDDHTPTTEIEALCTELIRRAEPRGAVRSSGSARAATIQTLRKDDNSYEGCREGGDEIAFASLAVPFIQKLAADSCDDVIKGWLLHRLQEIVIQNQRLLPGEIEMLRADITERVMMSRLSEEDKNRLSVGFVTILNSLVLDTCSATGGTVGSQS